MFYSIALRINRLIYLARRALALREWSFTAWLKRRVSDARAHIALCEEAATTATGWRAVHRSRKT
ncbi:MAG: hypothetical protein ACRETI_02655 [Steroidobacteraceae bacterium]